MKRLSILLFASTVLVANAEPTRTAESLEAQTARRAKETPPIVTEKIPNEIKAVKLTYSGIAVEIVKVDNPLQLINPAAPAEYGWAEQNIVWKPDGSKISGLKIFSMEF